MGKPKVIATILVFVLLSSIGFLFPNILRRGFTAFARPVWFLKDSAVSHLSSTIDFFKFKSNLIQQNLALQDQIAALKLKEVDYDAVVAENQSLKADFARLPAPERSDGGQGRVLAAVLSKPPQSPYDTFVLDAGSAEGIALGDKVFVSDTIIIGTITSVEPHTAIATLFSSSNQKNPAVLGRTGTSYELSGQGGANFSLVVPKDTDVLWGDSFMYPGLSTAVLATVYYIDTNSQSSFKTTYLRTPGNVFSTRFVFIEKSQ